jgi:hypothetical protein
VADHGASLSWRSDRPYEAALTIDLSASNQPASVSISGLTITHFSPSIAQNYAVYVPQPTALADASSFIELKGCDISSASGSGIGVEGGCVSVESCIIHDCKNHGILFLGQTARGKVLKSTATNCKLNGVLLRDGAAAAVEQNELIGNGQYGAALIDCQGYFASSNVAKRNGRGNVSGECDAVD